MMSFFDSFRQHISSLMSNIESDAVSIEAKLMAMFHLGQAHSIVATAAVAAPPVMPAIPQFEPAASAPKADQANIPQSVVTVDSQMPGPGVDPAVPQPTSRLEQIRALEATQNNAVIYTGMNTDTQGNDFTIHLPAALEKAGIAGIPGRPPIAQQILDEYKMATRLDYVSGKDVEVVDGAYQYKA